MILGWRRMRCDNSRIERKMGSVNIRPCNGRRGLEILQHVVERMKEKLKEKCISSSEGGEGGGLPWHRPLGAPNCWGL